MKDDIREPSCIHDRYQPASACDVCVHGTELAEWKVYWSSPEGQARIPSGFSQERRTNEV